MVLLICISCITAFCLLLGGEFTSPNQERFHHYKVKLSSSCFCFSFICQILILIPYVLCCPSTLGFIGLLDVGPED